MANRLIKQSVLKVTPGVIGTPSVPGYCVWELVPPNPGVPDVVADIKINVSAQELKTYRSGYTQYTYLGNIYSSLNEAVYAAVEANRLYEYYPVQVCYPAIKGTPSIPAKTEYNPQTGWNAGGRSIHALAGNGYAEFEVGPMTVGAVVGFSSGFNGVNPGEQCHGFYAHGGQLDIIEGGTVVHTVSAPSLGDRPRLRISRRGGVVKYYVAGVERYISATPSVGQVYLDASLYTSSDYVDNPVLAAVVAGSASGRVGITALIDRRGRATGSVGISGSARGRAGSRVYCTASGLVGVSGTAAGVAKHAGSATAALGISADARAAEALVLAVAPRFVVAGGDVETAGAHVTYAGWATEAAGGYPEILSAGGDGVVPPFLGVAIVLAGGVANVDSVNAGVASKSGDHAYGEAAAAWGAYRSYSYDQRFADDAVAQGEAIFLGDTFEPFGDVMAEFASVLQIGDEWVVELVLEQGGEWLETLLVGASVASSGDLDAAFSDQLYLTDQGEVRGLGGIQYATNIQSGAITRYSGFDFLSIMTTPDGSYGVRADGIYRIGHDSAGRQPIDMHVDFGARDFGTTQLKRIDALYFGMTTDGSVLAVLRADDGTEQTYRVADRDATRRVLTAKGVSGRRWRLRLEVYEATQAELETVELSVNVMGRRLK